MPKMPKMFLEHKPVFGIQAQLGSWTESWKKYDIKNNNRDFWIIQLLQIKRVMIRDLNTSERTYTPIDLKCLMWKHL